MRILILAAFLSAPAYASRSELEPRPATPATVLVCKAEADKSKEVKHGQCQPTAEIPTTKPSLSDRKAK